VVRFLGVGLLLVFLVTNPVFVGWMFSSGGVIRNPAINNFLWLFSLFFLCVAVLFQLKTRALARHLSKNWANYILMLVSVTVLVGGFELILRCQTAIIRRGPVYVKTVDFEYVANVNSLGFRDGEFSKSKEHNTTRIFLIGDSFVYGAGVDNTQTLDKLLENMTGFEVFSLGKPGWNTEDYFRVAEAFRDYDPDMVLILFYVDNDLVLPKSSFLYNFEIVKRLRELSFDPTCKYPRVKTYNVTESYKEMACRGEVNVGLLDKANQVGDFHIYYENLGNDFKEARQVQSNLKTIFDLYSDIPVTLVLVPSKYQLSPGYFEELRELGFVFSRNEKVSHAIQDEMKAWADLNGLSYLDLLEYAGSGEEYFHAIDDHFNEAGNLWVSESLFETLLKPFVG